MLGLIMCMCMAGQGNWQDLAKNSQTGVLSTDYKGMPFGSVTPYVLDSEGKPILFLSNLAIHTDNINKNSVASLTVSKIDDDPFNSQRVTWVGKIVKISGKERDIARQLFLDKYKDKAKDIIDFQDFDFYRIDYHRIYHIGGFGNIGWLDLDDYRKAFK